MAKALYIPAQGEQLNSVIVRDLNYKGFDLKYFTDKSHFKMPALLQSAYYGIYGVGKRFEGNYRETLGIPKETLMVGDSVDKEETIIIRKVGEENFQNQQIGEFVDTFMFNKEISDSGHEFNNNIDYEVLTIDDDMKVCCKKINQVIRHKVNKQSIEIVTTGGKQIKITADHSLMQIKDNELVAALGSNSNKGDILITCNNNRILIDTIQDMNLGEFNNEYVYDLSVEGVERFLCSGVLVHNSGGYQIASWARKGEVCQLEPIDSLRWQEENCDVAMNLDVPPNIDGNPSYDDFMKALVQSVKNFELFEKERKNYTMRLLNVLHGETLPMMDIWYNAVKHFKFDGWAVGMKPPFDPMIQALGFLYLWEKGEFDKDSCKNFHFFGTSGKHVVPAIVYIAHKLGARKITVSYDSSSYNIGSIYRTYYMPFDIGPHLSFGDKFKNENPHLKELPCKCPVCSSIGSDIEILNGTDIYAGALISLHNLYQYWQYNDLLNSLVEDKEKFIDYLQKINISPKVLKSIEFIDYAMEKGLANAVEVFKHDLMLQIEFDKTKQATIWGF
jgi:hypothetical protein